MNHLKLFQGILPLLFSFLFSSVVYTQTLDDFICFYDDTGTLNPTNSTDCSHNGDIHTPEGTLRILVVFAGFEGFEGTTNPNDPSPFLSGWNNNISDFYELPYYVNLNQDGTITMDEFMYTDENDLQPGEIDPSTNISNTMYLMSRPNREFKVIGSVFSDPSGKPRQVVIPAQGLGNWYEANRRVAETMMDIWVNEGSNQQALDYFAQFDQRTNNPNYAVSNVNSPPDSIIDMVAYIYRYSPSWNIQPLPGMPGWTGSGGGLFSSNMTIPQTVINTYFFHNGFLAARGAGNPKRLFFHEFGHALWDAPHNCGSNGVSGNHFPVGHTGIGQASAIVPIFNPMMAAWERWHLGFSTPFEPGSTEGTHLFTINDLVTTGDAIRVALPFPEGSNKQYLWIENHAHQHPLDEHIYNGNDLNFPGNNDPEHIITNNDAGIYMYVEDMVEDCNDTYPFGDGGNMYMINPQGNWDIYRNVNEPQSMNAWQALMYPYEYIRQNPISGTNPWFKYRADTNPNFPGISFDSNNNSTGGIFGDPNESDIIYREQFDDNLYHHTYRAFGVNGNAGNSTAFQTGDELNMGTNPTITNYPEYNEGSQKVEPYILNGLSVKILSSGPQAQIEISYKQTEIDNNVLWTGDIILPDITQDNRFDLVLAENRKITLDVSKTPHRELINPLTNDYINPSNLTISSSAKLHMLENSNLTVKGGSTLVIEDGAEVLLKDGACIVIEEDGFLELKGNKIHLNGEDALISIRGTLITADGVDFTFTGSGYADFYENHVLDMGQNSNFILGRDAGDVGTRFLLLQENTTLNVSDRILELRDGAIEYKGKTKIQSANAEVTLWNTDFINIDQTGNPPDAFEGNNLVSCLIRYSSFEEFVHAILLSGNTTIPNIRANDFTHCVTAVDARDMDEISIIDNYFSEQEVSSIKLENIDVAAMWENVIIHLPPYMGIGCNLKNVNFAYISMNGLIQHCEKGVLAEASNVFVGNGATISDGNIGVQFVNNPTANYMLSVGRCKCGNIINNNIGVQGDNIILDIDAPNHQVECNSASIYPNRFDGNTLVFDICYTDSDFPASNTILMRSNYWGGLSLSNYSYHIRNGATQTGCAANTNISIDDSGFVTAPYPPGPCQITEFPPSYPQTPQYPPVAVDPIRCEITDNGILIEVHEQSRVAYESLYNNDYQDAKIKYTPVANLDRSNNPDDRCINKINIARCMVDAVDNDQYAAPYSSWVRSSVRPDPFSDGEIALYPNPASQSFTIESKQEGVYMVNIYNIFGQKVGVFEYTKKKTCNIGHLRSGVYLLEITNIDGVQVQTKKLIVE